jgi:nicotinamide riboside kinase
VREVRRPAWRLAIVGAESTGKSTLAHALAQRLGTLGPWRTTWVAEHLRAWCDAHGRTPLAHEQQSIAAEQAHRIEAAEASHDIVVCDTTPLMTAVYSRQVFGDRSLEAMALDWQRQCHLTLLTALDLPWQADGLQRDGPQVREPVDTALRELLIGAALPFVVIAGQGAARLDAAIDAVTPHLLAGTSGATGLFTRLAKRDAAQPAWAWVCETCDSPGCEHASLKQARERLLQSR